MRFLLAVGDAIFHIPWGYWPVAVFLPALFGPTVCRFPQIFSALPSSVSMDRAAGVPRFRIDRGADGLHIPAGARALVLVRPCGREPRNEFLPPVWVVRVEPGKGQLGTRWNPFRGTGAPELLNVRYGETLPGWQVEVSPGPLKPGVPYELYALIERESARTIFVLQGDSVLASRVTYPPRKVTGCWSRIAQGDEDRDRERGAYQGHRPLKGDSWVEKHDVSAPVSGK